MKIELNVSQKVSKSQQNQVELQTLQTKKGKPWQDCHMLEELPHLVNR